MGIKVFVYGTLLSGFGNYNYYLKDKAKLIDKNASVEKFKIFDLGYFPACIFTDNPEDVVHGEVYSVCKETLRDLDRLEGYPRYYDRMNVNNLLMMEYPITMREPIWIYIQKIEQLRESAEHIESGNWREFCKEKRGDQ